MGLRTLSFVMFFAVQLAVVQSTFSAERQIPQTLPQSSPQPMAVQKAPAVPSKLVLTVVSGSQIDLKWDDNSTNETGFAIERKTGNGQFTEIGRVTRDVTSYSDKGTSKGITYTYRVRAFNNAGYSVYCDEKSAIPQDQRAKTEGQLQLSPSDVKKIKTLISDWRSKKGKDVSFDKADLRNSYIKPLIERSRNVLTQMDQAVADMENMVNKRDIDRRRFAELADKFVGIAKSAQSTSMDIPLVIPPPRIDIAQYEIDKRKEECYKTHKGYLSTQQCLYCINRPKDDCMCKSGYPDGSCQYYCNTSGCGTCTDDPVLANIDLQNQLQCQQWQMQMISNIAKQIHDTALAIIRKIG